MRRARCIAPSTRFTAGVSATAAAPRYGVVICEAANVTAHAAPRRAATRRRLPAAVPAAEDMGPESVITMPTRYQMADIDEYDRNIATAESVGGRRRRFCGGGGGGGGAAAVQRGAAKIKGGLRSKITGCPGDIGNGERSASDVTTRTDIMPSRRAISRPRDDCTRGM